jgi:hypothetical protein
VLDAVVSFSEVSVAKSVQLTPVLIVTAENAATPATAGTDSVPASAHDEVIAIVSVKPVVARAPVPSSTVTSKVESTAPAFVGLEGSVVKPSFVAVAAPAGEEATMSAPVAKRAEQAPIERTLLSVERSDWPPPRFLITCMMIPLSIDFFPQALINALPKG